MSVHVVKVPDIGEGIAEVEVVEWYVQPGDTIKADQTVADLMTDKATVEVPSPISGRVVSLGGKAGDKLAVGAELIRLETEGATSAPPSATAAGPRACGWGGECSVCNGSREGHRCAADTRREKHPVDRCRNGDTDVDRKALSIPIRSPPRTRTAG